jgi:hypothetical protein
LGKVDFKKTLKHLYSVSAEEPAIVDVPSLRFAMVDGAGDPSGSVEFQQAMEALYSVSYTLKFTLKKSQGFDYVVPPPEGLWWMEGESGFDVRRKDLWRWTLMIMQPEPMTSELFAEAVAQVKEKRNPPGLVRLRFERYDEGLSAQVLHLGPYAAEVATIAKLHAFIRDRGYDLRGKHHEIYLSDPRRSAPEKMKTILRQPVTRK